MGNYLETIYFRDETGENAYPQKLCTHIVDEYFCRQGDVKGKTVLDIGSGKGNHLIGFSRRGMTAFGLDKRPECIEALKDFDIRPCDLEKEPFPFKDDTFDFVFSKSVLEHVVNADNFLSESLRVLKPGGMAVLLTPDWQSQCLHFWDDYTHVKAFTRKSLQDAMRIHNFENAECSYFLQLPYTWQYKWTKRPTEVLGSLIPQALKWKDSEEKEFRAFFRFAKERMLLAVGYKKKHV